MSIEFWDSFDTSTDYLTWWTSELDAAGFLIEVISSEGRFGTAALRMQSNNNSVWLQKTLTAVQTRVIATSFRFSVHPGGGRACDIMGLLDGSSLQCDLRLHPDGRLSVTRNGTVLGTSTFSLTANTTYHIQFKIKVDSTTGTVDVKVDDASILSLTGQNTQATANATTSAFYLGTRFVTSGFLGNANSLIYYDDVVVLNTSGSINNDFPGDVRVQSTLPTGAGTTTNLTPSTGSNYQNVDDNPPNDDTDYNYSATPDDIDTYAMGDITSTSGSVLGVASRMRLRKDSAGAKTIAAAIRTNANNYFGSNQNVNTTYFYYSELWETNPNTTNPFTISEVNNIEAGIKIIS